MMFSAFDPFPLDNKQLSPGPGAHMIHGAVEAWLYQLALLDGLIWKSNLYFFPRKDLDFMWTMLGGALRLCSLSPLDTIFFFLHCALNKHRREQEIILPIPEFYSYLGSIFSVL